MKIINQNKSSNFNFGKGQQVVVGEVSRAFPKKMKAVVKGLTFSKAR